ncbi:hypothetical protein [Streptomyces sp. CB01881]|nr:hypothetical protein [Streptomyces sp. CB01881]
MIERWFRRRPLADNARGAEAPLPQWLEYARGVLQALAAVVAIVVNLHRW